MVSRRRNQSLSAHVFSRIASRRLQGALLGLAIAAGTWLWNSLPPPKHSGTAQAESKEIPAAPVQQSSAVNPDLVEADITHCHDGDTCRILTRRGKLWFNVRLAGIDAPEVENRRRKSSGQNFGGQSRDAINALVKDRVILVRQVDLDSYNRPVAELYDGSKNLNLIMIEQGFAEAYRGKVKRIDEAAYLAAEATARKAKSGIWGLASYESPAEYRKKSRN